MRMHIAEEGSRKRKGGGEKRRRRRRGRTKKMEKASESELGFERKRRDKQKDRDEDRRTEQVDKKKSAVPWPYNIQRTYHIQLAYAFNLLCGFSDDILCFNF